jgi:hypothetical protein
MYLAHLPSELAHQLPSAASALVTLEGGQQGSLVVYGSALAAGVAVLWALLERQERRTSQRQNSELSSSVQKLIEQHFRERVQAEERNSMSLDSAVRNVLESLERGLLGKPKD